MDGTNYNSIQFHVCRNQLSTGLLQSQSRTDSSTHKNATNNLALQTPDDIISIGRLHSHLFSSSNCFLADGQILSEYLHIPFYSKYIKVQFG